MKKENKLLSLINNLDEYFVVYAIGVMGIVLFMQVFARYVFNMPLTWSEELARYIFVWIAFIGAGYGVKNHLHIEMEALFNKFPKKVQLVLQVVLNLMSIGFFAYLIPGGIQYTTQQAGLEAIALKIPMSVDVISVPIGCVLVIIRLIIDTINVIRTKEIKHSEGGDIA